MNWPTAFVAGIGIAGMCWALVVFIRHAFKSEPTEKTYEQRKEEILKHDFLKDYPEFKEEKCK